MKPYLQYLVILLDDTSVAYCHADNPLKERNLMPIETLRKAILFGMKQNLMIQYVYPEYELPEEYEEVIESIDHLKIGSDVKVFNEVPTKLESDNVVIRLKIADFISKQYDIAALLPQAKRLNICLTDIESFKDEQQGEYEKALNTLSSVLLNLYKEQKQPQLNILTDRLQLTEMHNCEAGIGNITVAPNGKFYLCPAFYYDERMGISNRMNHITKDATRSVGDLDNGLNIPNKQLLQLDHAPLCRICDAYHCNRCIWLNQKLTWDNNTPSHQQCVISHLERNATRQLLADIRKIGEFLPELEIKEIEYLDPFDVKEEC
ncbi:MAG: CXXX repeat peptide maturase [Paludibacteraceae bacterium]|nr:CXXX repeat peptide maturase [Paludibacteraceae bacterium]